ncbi:STAS domain-containing protein [uncultured Algibacter sp.]|uniref:STAS domain-containing protein n=1 Tax=uncultured Algibacter sp. TaxID=298659 RepID=UPI00261992AE|nr:STAS domain-containing protein [uncultured Algibacter sp.]
MSLKIKESNGEFKLEGVINSNTQKQFKDHLDFLLAYSKSVTINIDAVTAINRNGLKIIEDLFKEAKLNNKAFCVVGYGCKDIYQSINPLTAKAA